MFICELDAVMAGMRQQKSSLYIVSIIVFGPWDVCGSYTNILSQGGV